MYYMAGVAVEDPVQSWDHSSPKRSPWQPVLDFKAQVTKEPLCPTTPSSVAEQPISHGFYPQQQCIQSTADFFSPSLIWECCKTKDLSRGIRLHDQLQKRGLVEKYFSDALVTMYAKCGELQKAQALLDKHNNTSIIPWTALIAGYTQQGKGLNALDCFERMQHEGISPNAVTYVCILKACAGIGAIDKGMQIHDEIAKQGLLEHNIVLNNALLDMYAKCDALPQAQSVLEKLPSRNIGSWNALIAGYVRKGQGQRALECFEQMDCEGIPPNAVTYGCILKVCAGIRDVDKGKEIHDEILKQGLLEHNVMLGTALVDMYVKCGALPQAQTVLEKLPSRDVISWSALITGYAQMRQGQRALECFEQMQHEGILPNAVTYASILEACAETGAIEKGKKIHEDILKQGLLEHDDVVLSTALLDMYAKCGSLPQAQQILEKLPSRNLVSWSALIAGYAQTGQDQQALESFEQMQCEGICPDAATYGCILKVCASIGAIDKGKKIHDEISKLRLLEHDSVLGSALVDMYAKCGALPQAQSVLEKLPSRDVVSWSALIVGYAQQGQGQQALDCFKQMEHEGILPDAMTILCLLSLCSHLGLVEKGQELFDSMEATYGLKPDEECFTCIVDLLGRAGHLAKAVEVIQGMPFPATSTIWHCLLGACRKWADVNVGTRAFKQAVELDKCDGAAYILMVNIYVAAGMQEKAKYIEAMRVNNKAWKLPGYID